MTITLRQTDQDGATNKNDSLSFAELDANFVDLLTNKIKPIQVDGDTGSVNVGQALQNGVLSITGSGSVSTAVTEDSAGNADLVITGSGISASDTATFTNKTFDANGTGNSISNLEVADFAGSAIINVSETLASNDVDTALVTAGAIIDYVDANAGISEVSSDTTPQLGGDLDVNSNKIVSTSNGNIDIEPNGTGNVLLGNFTFDADQSVGAGQDDYVLTYDHSAGTISLEAASSGGINNVVEDTTPQLGGMLDVNGNAIGDGSLELLKFSETASAVNEITITNAATGGNPDISATGDDTNIDLSLTAKGTGEIALNDDTNVNGNKLKDAQLENYKETIHALSYAANISPDVANGNVQEITLTGNVAFDGFSNAEDGQSMTLIIHQDGTGSRTFSENLDSAGRMLFAGGTSTLTTDGGATDIMSIVYAGGIYYASLSTNFS